MTKPKNKKMPPQNKRLVCYGSEQLENWLVRVAAKQECSVSRLIRSILDAERKWGGLKP
jgi:hypothetical protein